MKTLIKKIVPPVYHKKVKYAILRAVYYGKQNYCNVCNSHVKKWLTLGYDLPVLEEKQIIGAGMRAAMCPVCMSSDRIRLLFHFLSHKTSVFTKPHKMLHIAPEPSLEFHFKKHKNIDYKKEGSQMAETITFTLVKSGIGSTKKINATLTGLGLTKMNKTVTRKDTPEIRGMLNKVSHLVKIEEI